MMGTKQVPVTRDFRNLKEEKVVAQGTDTSTSLHLETLGRAAGAATRPLG